MDAEAVASEFPTKLAYGLKERGGLDVAHSSPDLGDNKIELTLHAERFDIALDLIGNVRNNLYGFAQIVAAPLFLYHALIDPSGGNIIPFGGLYVEETLVVSQVEVGFIPVHSNIAFAMLIGVKGSGVDINIGVELLNGDFIAS
jgi:hypothetical protein